MKHLVFLALTAIVASTVQGSPVQGEGCFYDYQCGSDEVCVDNTCKGALSCDPWPPKSSSNACKHFRGYFKVLNEDMDISQTKECEKLCKRQNGGGCCIMEVGFGCSWMSGAISSSDASGASEGTSVTCYP